MVRMGTPANPRDDPDDAAALRAHAMTLADAVVGALPAWVERSVATRFRDWSGDDAPAPVVAAAREAGQAAVRDVEPALRTLLSQDVDEQRTNPLSIIRRAVVHPTGVLQAAGVAPVERDAHAERLFPDDLYDLAPATFGDLDAAVHEPGLVWGAAKAHVVLRRRRAEGR
jgi:hypothetical protein